MLSVSAFATTSSPELADYSDAITVESTEYVAIDQVQEDASCTITVDITQTDAQGNTTTTQGTITVNTDCMTVIKAYASA